MSRRIFAVLAVLFLLLALSPTGYGQQGATAPVQQQIVDGVNNWIVQTLHDADTWFAQLIEVYAEDAESDEATAAAENSGSKPEESAMIATNALGEERYQQDGETVGSNTVNLDGATIPSSESSKNAGIIEEKPKVDPEEESEDNQGTESEEDVEEAPREMSGEGRKAETGNGNVEIAVSPGKKDQDGSVISYFFAVGVIVLLVAGSQIAIAIQKKKKQQNTIQRTYQPVISADSEFITILFLSGKKNGCEDVMLRKDRYVVGSSLECDLILPGINVDDKHACIYTRDGRQYIEDLDSDDGTYLDGMRLFSANRLRKNNVVTIGTNSFKVTF